MIRVMRPGTLGCHDRGLRRRAGKKLGLYPVSEAPPQKEAKNA